jgi:hypothetical protein
MDRAYANDGKTSNRKGQTVLEPSREYRGRTWKGITGEDTLKKKEKYKTKFKKSAKTRIHWLHPVDVLCYS